MFIIIFKRVCSHHFLKSCLCIKILNLKTVCVDQNVYLKITSVKQNFLFDNCFCSWTILSWNSFISNKIFILKIVVFIKIYFVWYLFLFIKKIQLKFACYFTLIGIFSVTVASVHLKVQYASHLCSSIAVYQKFPIEILPGSSYKWKYKNKF